MIDFSMLYLDIGLVAIVIFVLYNYLLSPVDHYITCDYCGTQNYVGTDRNSTFHRDHVKQYRCKFCKADLFPRTTDEIVNCCPKCGNADNFDWEEIQIGKPWLIKCLDCGHSWAEKED